MRAVQSVLPCVIGLMMLGMASAAPAPERFPTTDPLAALLRETDVLVSVPHDRAARVREVHTLVLHCLSDGVDTQLLGEQEIPL